MSTRERVEELLADVLPRLEALKEEALAEIGAIRADAGAKLARHEDATEELADVEARISALQAEREELPERAYRAGLDEEYALEDKLKERYKNLRPEIDTLEDRRGSLKEELHRLNPRSHGHRHDCSMYQFSRVAGTASEQRRALESLRERFVKALDDALAPVRKAHDQNRSVVEAWGEERKWDPAFQAQLQRKQESVGGGGR
jgi:predicted  nucleic acid-binding Zn-ribbon protein